MSAAPHLPAAVDPIGAFAGGCGSGACSCGNGGATAPLQAHEAVDAIGASPGGCGSGACSCGGGGATAPLQAPEAVDPIGTSPGGCGSGACSCGGGGATAPVQAPEAVDAIGAGGCGSSACSCGGGGASPAPAASGGPIELPRVNGIALQDPSEQLSSAELRQRACTELLRQAAMAQGLLPADDPIPQGGAISEAACTAIGSLLDGTLQLPEPEEAACRRHHAAHAARYAVGERVHARHVLFAVTPGVDVNALRQRAEACLLDVRNATPEEQAAGDRFAAAARANSNCPSGATGGDLGWLSREDCAPEFARELLGHAEVGVLPRLVHSRFGLHVVEVLAREAGVVPSYEQVQAAVAQALRQQSYATALSQYLQLLAGQARMAGVDLAGADTPLVQ